MFDGQFSALQEFIRNQNSKYLAFIAARVLSKFSYFACQFSVWLLRKFVNGRERLKNFKFLLLFMFP